MEAIVIEVTNEADIKFWLKLARKTGTRAKAINTDYIEDTDLAALVEKGMHSKTVSRKSIMDILDRGNED